MANSTSSNAKNIALQVAGVALSLGVLYLTFRVASAGWNAGKK
jgi:hypothetical protein